MKTLEEAIRYYEEQAKKCNNRVNEIILGAERCKQEKEENTQLADWLRELQERREWPGWTQISDGYPKIGQRVLVTLDDGTMDIRRCKLAEYFDCYYGDVIAWMPAPEPYQSEESTEKRTETHGVCLDVISRQAAKLKVARVVWEKGDTAEDFNDKCVDCLDDVQPVEAIPVSWIAAKIELVNDLPGVSMLKMKAADWVDLVKQWRAEQRNPEVDHDAQIREFAEEMSKHGVT